MAFDHDCILNYQYFRFIPISSDDFYYIIPLSNKQDHELLNKRKIIKQGGIFRPAPYRLGCGLDCTASPNTTVTICSSYLPPDVRIIVTSTVSPIS